MLDRTLEVDSQFLPCLARKPSSCFPTARLFCLCLITSSDLLSHGEAALFKMALMFGPFFSWFTSLLLPPITLSSSAFWINSTDVIFVFKYKHSVFILGLTKIICKPIDNRWAKNWTLQSWRHEKIHHYLWVV